MSETRTKIVVADDEAGIRMLMTEILEEAGFEVLEASDGTEAVNLIQSTDDLEMVITDINMPGFNGFVVGGHARERYPAIPILFVSGRYADVSDQTRIDNFQFLKKPFQLSALLGEVRRLLPRHSLTVPG